MHKYNILTFQLQNHRMQLNVFCSKFGQYLRVMANVRMPCAGNCWITLICIYFFWIMKDCKRNGEAFLVCFSAPSLASYIDTVQQVKY